MKVRELTFIGVPLLARHGSELEFFPQRLDFKRYQEPAASDTSGRDTSGLGQVERCPLPGFYHVAVDLAPGTVLIEGIRSALSRSSTLTCTYRNRCNKLN